MPESIRTNMKKAYRDSGPFVNNRRAYLSYKFPTMRTMIFLRETDLVRTKWASLIILMAILYTNNLGISFKISWEPQGERKNWVPTLPLLKSEPQSNFPPITSSLFSTFPLIRCHSLSSFHYFPPTRSHFLYYLSSSFPIFSLSRLLCRSE